MAKSTRGSVVLAKLQRAAKDAANNAYAPYSGFRVGAAVLSDAGVFTGANVENASYGLCNCAERGAIFASVNAGARRLKCVVVYTPTANATPPCGACRQVIFEFGPDARVVSCCDGREMINTSIGALLPGAFGPADLGFGDPAYGGGVKPARKRSKKAS